MESNAGQKVITTVAINCQLRRQKNRRQPDYTFRQVANAGHILNTDEKVGNSL